MKQYALRMTAAAMEDLEELYSYIATDLGSSRNAYAQTRRIADTVESLAWMPERYPPFSFLDLEALKLRRVSVDRYLIFYLVDDNRVTVTDILCGDSDLPGQLQERHEG